MDGSVLSIYICKAAGDPMCSVGSVRAFLDRGLEGDRYWGTRGSFSKSGRSVKRHVTLIAAEDIAAANRGTDAPFRPEDTRRNIVTVGIPLAKLIGYYFTIGGVSMRGVEYCDPCDRPSQLSGIPGFRTVFAEHAGIRAEVLTSGYIRCGDRIWSCDGYLGIGEICLGCERTSAEHEPR